MDTVVNVTLFGDSACGKTSLANAYVYNKFSSEYIPTKIFDLFVENIMFENRPINLRIWDTGDAVESRGNVSGSVTVLCFDLSDRASFASLSRHWIPFVKKSKSNGPFIIVGLKADLVNGERQCQALRSCAREFLIPELVHLTESFLRWSDTVPQEVVTLDEIRELVQSSGAYGYTECSSRWITSSSDALSRAKIVFRMACEAVLHSDASISQAPAASISQAPAALSQEVEEQKKPLIRDSFLFRDLEGELDYYDDYDSDDDEGELPQAPLQSELSCNSRPIESHLAAASTSSPVVDLSSSSPARAAEPVGPFRPARIEASFSFDILPHHDCIMGRAASLS